MASQLQVRVPTGVLAAAVGLLVNVLAVANAHAGIVVKRINIGLPNTAVFVVRGDFDGNEILRFKSAIADVPPATRIIAVLNSPGGRLDQGFALGKFFYEARIVTVVMASDGQCASACQRAFFGGRDPHTNKPLRILFEGGKLGFHNFKSNFRDAELSKDDLLKVSYNAQEVALAALQYYIAVGAPIQAYQLALGTISKDMHYVTESEALEIGISVVNMQVGKLVSPDNLRERTR